MTVMDHQTNLGMMTQQILRGQDSGPDHVTAVALLATVQRVSETNEKVEGMTEVEVEAGQKKEIKNRVSNGMQQTYACLPFNLSAWVKSSEDSLTF